MAVKRKFGGSKKKSGKRARVGKYKPKFNRKPRVTRNLTRAMVGQGFPKQMTMTHKYVDVIAVACASGVPQPYVFRCNGMFDPNVTSTGHQPMFFDQMAALYDHYTVIGSKITVRFTPLTSGNQAVPSYAGIFINDDATVTSGTLTTLLENSLVKSKLMSYGSTKPTILTHKWGVKKYFPGSTMANSELRGTATSDPTEQSTYTIFLCSLDTTTSVTLYAEVEISYIAVWNELKEIAGS